MFDDLNSLIKMTIFSNIKTNSFIETLFMIFGFMVMTCIYNFTNDNDFNIYNLFDEIKSFFYKKHVLVLEGKRCTFISFGSVMVSCTFTDRFNAIWHEILDNIGSNKSISEIRELTNKIDRVYENEDNDDKGNNKTSSLFIVSQKRNFLYNKELQIYGLSEVRLSEDVKGSNDNKDKNLNHKIDRIIITLYSYQTSLNDMIKHVDSITDKYTDSIEKSRMNKRFIYTINKTHYEDNNTYECWDEHPFESARTFDNIFFKEKAEVIKKINFFLENKDWYYAMGIPYTLGFGLHGPPGTGKTSLIKSIANMTNRHIVILSLKMIKTRSQLMQFFFENRYNQKNKNNSIDFYNKILVIEDIDCSGDIILKRGGVGSGDKKKEIKVEDVLVNLMENQKKFEEEKYNNKYGRGGGGGGGGINITNDTTDQITLDDILNLWDGIKETPGRIMIISSNHYDMLDPALIRPGRIDITIELNNASREIIAQMFEKFYKCLINKKQLEKINDFFYSPAEIINLFVLHMNDSKKFMERLMQNKKLS